jgi:hypothetical protein
MAKEINQTLRKLTKEVLMQDNILNIHKMKKVFCKQKKINLWKKQEKLKFSFNN